MEEKLVLEYIGKNADKIINKKLNWPAAILSVFFGPVWFFYRKSYLLGFILLYFMGIGFYYTGLGHFISWGLFIGIAIKFLAYLFFANTLYLLDVKRKVKNIMHSQIDMSEEQVIDVVREKGGTSRGALTIYIAINIIIKIALAAIVMYIVTYVEDSGFGKISMMLLIYSLFLKK